VTTETTGPDAVIELEALRARVTDHLPAYLRDLERLVNIDCGSYTPAGVDEIGRWVSAYLEGMGADVEVRPDATGRYGSTIVGTFSDRARARLNGTCP